MRVPPEPTVIGSSPIGRTNLRTTGGIVAGLERVYSNLLVEPTEYNSYTRDVEVTTPLADVQAHYVKEINQLLSEEGLPYEFRDGQFVRPGKQSTQQATARATYVLGARGLRDARAHFIKALDYFRKSPEEADHPNA